MKMFLKELRNCNRNNFSVRHKNTRKHNQHFMINLHFGISNSLSKYRKINLILINSIYLVFSSLEVQIILKYSCIPKYTTSFFTPSEKKAFTNLQSIATTKNIFSSVYVIGTTCFDKLFLFHVTTGRQCFL